MGSVSQGGELSVSGWWTLCLRVVGPVAQGVGPSVCGWWAVSQVLWSVSQGVGSSVYDLGVK